MTKPPQHHEKEAVSPAEDFAEETGAGVPTSSEPGDSDPYGTGEAFRPPSYCNAMRLSRLSQPCTIYQDKNELNRGRLYPPWVILPLPRNDKKFTKLAQSIGLYFRMIFTMIVMFSLLTLFVTPATLALNIIASNHGESSAQSNGLNSVSLGAHGSNGMPAYHPACLFLGEICISIVLLYFGRTVYKYAERSDKGTLSTEDFSVHISSLDEDNRLTHPTAAKGYFESRYGPVADVVVAKADSKVSKQLMKIRGTAEKFEEKRQKARLINAVGSKVGAKGLVEKRDKIVGMEKMENKLIELDQQLGSCLDEVAMPTGDLFIVFQTRRAAQMCRYTEQSRLWVKKTKKRIRCCLCLWILDLIMKQLLKQASVLDGATGNVNSAEMANEAEKRGRSGSEGGESSRSGEKGKEKVVQATGNDGEKVLSVDEYRVSYDKHCDNVQIAPNPDDIIWENLEITSRKRWLIRILTYTFILTLIVVLAAVTFAFDRVSIYLKTNHGSGGLHIGSFNILPYLLTIMAMSGSIVISTCNFLLKFSILLFSTFEGYRSHTYMHASVMTRIVVAQLLNSVLMVFFVRPDPNHWYETGGGAETVFWMVLSNATVAPILNFSRPGQIIRHYLLAPLSCAQPKLNRLLQRDDFGISQRYANIIRTVAFGIIYGPMSPILYPVTVLGLVNYYIFDKAQVLYRVKRPRNYHKILAVYARRLVFFIYLIHIPTTMMFLLEAHFNNSSSTSSSHFVAGQILTWTMFGWMVLFFFTPRIFLLPFYRINTLKDFFLVFKTMFANLVYLIKHSDKLSDLSSTNGGLWLKRRSSTIPAVAVDPEVKMTRKSDSTRSGILGIFNKMCSAGTSENDGALETNVEMSNVVRSGNSSEKLQGVEAKVVSEVQPVTESSTDENLSNPLTAAKGVGIDFLRQLKLLMTPRGASDRPEFEPGSLGAAIYVLDDALEAGIAFAATIRLNSMIFLRMVTGDMPLPKYEEENKLCFINLQCTCEHKKDFPILLKRDSTGALGDVPTCPVHTGEENDFDGLATYEPPNRAANQIHEEDDDPEERGSKESKWRRADKKTLAQQEEENNFTTEMGDVIAL